MFNSSALMGSQWEPVLVAGPCSSIVLSHGWMRQRAAALCLRYAVFHNILPTDRQTDMLIVPLGSPLIPPITSFTALSMPPPTSFQPPIDPLWLGAHWTGGVQWRETERDVRNLAGDWHRCTTTLHLSAADPRTRCWDFCRQSCSASGVIDVWRGSRGRGRALFELWKCRLTFNQGSRSSLFIFYLSASVLHCVKEVWLTTILRISCCNSSI